MGRHIKLSYQWQQNTIKRSPFGHLYGIVKKLLEKDGECRKDLNYIEPSLEPGMYYFRCMVTSPYGCGTIYTNTIFVEVKDCSFSRIGQDLIVKKPYLRKLIYWEHI